MTKSTSRHGTLHLSQKGHQEADNFKRTLKAASHIHIHEDFEKTMWIKKSELTSKKVSSLLREKHKVTFDFPNAAPIKTGARKESLKRKISMNE